MGDKDGKRGEIALKNANARPDTKRLSEVLHRSAGRQGAHYMNCEGKHSTSYETGLLYWRLDVHSYDWQSNKKPLRVYRNRMTAVFPVGTEVLATQRQSKLLG